MLNSYHAPVSHHDGLLIDHTVQYPQALRRGNSAWPMAKFVMGVVVYNPTLLGLSSTFSSQHTLATEHAELIMSTRRPLEMNRLSAYLTSRVGILDFFFLLTE